MTNLSQILKHLEKQRNQVRTELGRLDAAISALRGMNQRTSATGIRGFSSRPRRTLSAAARKKIAAAQRARWAGWKARQKKTA